MARLPEYWQSKNGIRKCGETRYTTAQGRYLKEMGLEEWNPREASRAKWRSKAKPSRPSNAANTGATSPAYNTDEAWVTSREMSVLPDPGTNAAQNQYALALASDHINNPWVMPRETGVYTDPNINAPDNQYPLQPSYLDTNNAWVPTQELYTYQDPGVTAPWSQYPVPPSYTYPPIDFPHLPQTYHTDLINAEFDDFDHDDGNNHDVSGHREMTDYFLADDMMIDPRLEQGPFSGLGNL